MKTRAEWLRKLTALNPAVNNKLGRGSERFAPHKPLLLLCLFELIEQGRLSGNRFTLMPDLLVRFQSYWRVVVSRWTTKPEVRMPFHHLSNQGFWKALTADLKPSKHRSLTEIAEIDPSFFEAVGDAAFRRHARAVLISQYFPPLEQLALRGLTGVGNEEAHADLNEIKEEARAYARSTARDARFRIQVVSSYLFYLRTHGLQPDDDFQHVHRGRRPY